MYRAVLEDNDSFKRPSNDHPKFMLALAIIADDVHCTWHELINERQRAFALALFNRISFVIRHIRHYLTKYYRL